jgi:hypothetical protein
MPYKDPKKKQAYHREYMRERYANDEEFRIRHKKLVKEHREGRKAEFREWLKTLCCSKCGENDHACLEFHHRDPSQKEIEISKAVSYVWSDERLEEEIKKCDILCSNCHRKLHRDIREQKDIKN